MKKISQATILLSLLSVLASFSFGCSSSTKGDLILLETFTKNSVTVSIFLGKTQDGMDALVASFAPPEGTHLYSKDIPRDGVNGLGRPTLLELTSASQMKTAGGLMESIPAQVPDFEPKDLLVYPAGVVTLTLPVKLPSGTDWVEDEISITFMACSDNGCKPPVENQIIFVQIPGSGVSSTQ